MTPSSHRLHPHRQHGHRPVCARHTTSTDSGALLQTLQLIRHQQVRGSSPRVGSSVFKRLQTNSTKSQDNVSPWCHHIARAQRRLTHAPVRQPSPRTLHRCGREPRPHPLVPVAQLDRASAFSAEGRRFESCRACHFPKEFADCAHCLGTRGEGVGEKSDRSPSKIG